MTTKPKPIPPAFALFNAQRRFNARARTYANHFVRFGVDHTLTETAEDELLHQALALVEVIRRINTKASGS
jgi:hypothetical protein